MTTPRKNVYKEDPRIKYPQWCAVVDNDNVLAGFFIVETFKQKEILKKRHKKKYRTYGNWHKRVISKRNKGDVNETKGKEVHKQGRKGVFKLFSRKAQ